MIIFHSSSLLSEFNQNGRDLTDHPVTQCQLLIYFKRMLWATRPTSGLCSLLVTLTNYLFFIVGHLDQLSLFILGHLDQLILFIVGHFDQLRLLDGSSTVTIACFL